MSDTTVKQLLESGAHFGHMRRKWNPSMAPYIFMEKNGIHIIDLNKTKAKLEDAAAALKQVAKSGKKILFVGTKKQAQEIVAEKILPINMPFVTERWPGGMLTNFITIRKTIKKLAAIDNMMKDGTVNTMNKKERLLVSRQKAKLEKDFGSVAYMDRLPSAMFIVDINREHIAVQEAKKLNIPTFGIVDTNSNPNQVDFPIPANDDAADSIALILDTVCTAIKEGIEERKAERIKDKEVKSKDKEQVENEANQKNVNAKTNESPSKNKEQSASTSTNNEKKAAKPKTSLKEKREKQKAEKVEEK